MQNFSHLNDILSLTVCEIPTLRLELGTLCTPSLRRCQWQLISLFLILTIRKNIVTIIISQISIYCSVEKHLIETFLTKEGVTYNSIFRLHGQVGINVYPNDKHLNGSKSLGEQYVSKISLICDTHIAVTFVNGGKRTKSECGNL